MKILIAEDEQRLAMALQQIMKEAGYEARCVYRGDEVTAELCRNGYDLLLLDVMLPGMDGFAVAAELRQQKFRLPILMLTAKDAVSDRVIGLDSGADDYLTKPFATEELLARIRALTRRHAAVTPEELSFGDLTFRSGNSSLKCGAKEIRLNYKESGIMKLLLSYPQFILSKEELINKVWGYDADTSDNNVEAYISFLRKKLQFLGSRVVIVSIKKQGYKLEYTPC